MMAKLVQAIMLLFVIVAAMHANAVPRFWREGGGGDPLANEFLELAKVIAKAQAMDMIDLGIEQKKLDDAIKQLEDSLEGQTPLLMFPPGTVVNCYGYPKLGCVEGNRIRVAREGWSRTSMRKRVALVTMELVKLLKGRKRYSLGESVAKTLDFMNSSGPTSIFDTTKKTDIIPLFDTTCQLPMINQAMSYVAAPDTYPQFDIARPDGIDNFTSSELLEFTKEGVSRKQTLFISTMFSGKDPRSFWAMMRKIDGQVEALVRMPQKFGDRIFTHAFYKESFSEYEPVTCARIKTVETYLLPAIPTFAENQASTGRVYPIVGEVPASLKYWADQAVPFFQPCAMRALNIAIERAARDGNFGRIADATNRTYEVLSAYHLRAEDKANGTQRYYISLNVKSWNFSLPYTFRITAKQQGESCKISEVTAH